MRCGIIWYHYVANHCIRSVTSLSLPSASRSSTSSVSKNECPKRNLQLIERDREREPYVPISCSLLVHIWLHFQNRTRSEMEMVTYWYNYSMQSCTHDLAYVTTVIAVDGVKYFSLIWKKRSMQYCRYELLVAVGYSKVPV